VPGGTVSRFKTRYAVRLTVPRRGGWRAWGAVRARTSSTALADLAGAAIAAAEIVCEVRRGAGYVRVAVAVSVAAAGAGGALAIAWGAFCDAAGDDLVGWEVTAASAEVSRTPVNQSRRLPVCGCGTSCRGGDAGRAAAVS
jgi:hypothetical protein